VNEAGVASEADALAGEAVPLAQERLTVTDAPLFGTKSLWTRKVPAFSVFVIVQETLPPFTSVLFAQSAWLAV
jgi:hypothetical protein